MVVIQEPIKIKLELMSNEIEYIIDELNRVPHNLYELLSYDKIVKKLNVVLEETNATKKT